VIASLVADADDVVCPLRTEHLYAIGLWYDWFPQVSDDEVRALLARAPLGSGPARAAADPGKPR
jgi:putative phosphoribosyl transferase